MWIALKTNEATGFFWEKNGWSDNYARGIIYFANRNL